MEKKESQVLEFNKEEYFAEMDDKVNKFLETSMEFINAWSGGYRRLYEQYKQGFTDNILLSSMLKFILFCSDGIFVIPKEKYEEFKSDPKNVRVKQTISPMENGDLVILSIPVDEDGQSESES